MAAELVIILAAVAAAIALVMADKETTERWFRRIAAARAVIFGVLSVIVALFLVGSGSPMLMLLGFAALVYGVLWIVFESPHDAVLDEL